MAKGAFMEHPTGQFGTAREAMEATIVRLRALPEWNRWITFCAQGKGESPESIHFAEVRLLSDMLETGVPINLAEIRSRADVPLSAITEVGESRYSVAAASPKEVAQILDALFRCQFGIRPFPDEGDDYPVGAEW